MRNRKRQFPISPDVEATAAADVEDGDDDDDDDDAAGKAARVALAPPGEEEQVRRHDETEALISFSFRWRERGDVQTRKGERSAREEENVFFFSLLDLFVPLA